MSSVSGHGDRVTHSRPARSASRPPWLGDDQRRWDHVRIHDSLLNHPDIGPYELAVYARLAWHAELATGNARPGQPTIAEEAKCSERQVRYSLSVLIKSGFVEVERKEGKPHVYRLLPPPRQVVPGSSDTPRQVVPPTPAGGAGPPRQVVPQNKNHKNKNQELDLKPLPSPSANGGGGRGRKPDLLFEALVQVEGADLSQLTLSARKRLNGAAKQLRDVGCAPEEIPRLAQAHRRIWPGATVTATSLAANRHRLTAPTNGGPYRDPPPDAYEDRRI